MYRFFELIPATLSWGTFALMIIASVFLPAWAAIFIILFDIFWFLRTVYYTFHLRTTFIKMQKNLKINWLQKLENRRYEKEKQNDRNVGWKDIYHFVVFPMFKEQYEVVRETFEALMKTNYPLDKFIITLALEERAGEEAQITGRKIKEEFGEEFAGFLIATHPDGLENEIRGKGSNQAWAAKKTLALIDDLKIPYENILISVFDVDTQVPPDYFGRLTYAYLTAKDPDRSSYQPIPFFLNNIFQAPAIGRVLSFGSSFWHMIQQSQPDILITFSSHSMPFKALVEIGFWDTDFVSEDSQIFWKLYMHYAGDWRVESLFFPVSMDANVAPTLKQTLINLYKQQRRWGWGAEMIPYMLNGFFVKPKKGSRLRGNEVPLRKKIHWALFLIHGHQSWATNAIMMFALGWLPLILGGAQFNASLLAYNLPRITSLLMQIAMVGLASTMILGIILLPPKPKWFKPWHYLLYIAQWFLVPITTIAFGAFPSLEAQTRLFLGGKFRLGFWVTPKHRNARTISNI